jgi:transcriptional regulator of acetoin/glycerol metabolism
VLLADDDTVCASDLGLRAAAGEAGAHLEDLTLQEVERALIEKALARNAGNVAGAARLLGLSRSAMYRRMERYGL